ncbi:MAG TPA: MarR family transcriptional regulator, partial [Thermoprotei archaeon]|nr:MarR family transcriptional regulator [Thermoprotei archaeon]
MSEVEEIVLNTLKEVGKPLRPGEIAERTGLDKKV